MDHDTDKISSDKGITDHLAQSHYIYGHFCIFGFFFFFFPNLNSLPPLQKSVNIDTLSCICMKRFHVNESFGTCEN